MKKTKRIIIISLIIFFLSMPLVFAKTPGEFPRLTFIIGTHEFTPYKEMTTQKIMLAAKTIPDGELEDMIIYYKNSKGQWVNSALPKSPAVTLPEYFVINFVDLVGMGVEPVTITTNPVDVSNLGPEELLKFTLATDTEGAEIYYTTNGESPIEHGTKYTNEVLFCLDDDNYSGVDLTIQAVAKNDGYYSEITTKDVTYDGLYDFENGKIIKYKGTAADVVIPSAIGGVTVDTIGENAFDQNTTLKNVTIPKSVEVIEDKAFYENTSLETLTFEAGSNLTTIGKWAFEQAEKLTALTIPESVTKIDEGAFAGTTALKSVRLPAGLIEVGEGVFADSGLEEVFIPSDLMLSDYMFYSCSNLKTVTIGSNVDVGAENFIEADNFRGNYNWGQYGGTGVYKHIEGIWINTTKDELSWVVISLGDSLDLDIWETENGLKANFKDAIDYAKDLLDDPNYNIDDIADLEDDIENAMEEMFVTGFKAAKGKTALVQPFMPVFIDIYGNAKFEALIDPQKEKSEAIGFINMEKIRLDEVTSVEDISNLIDGAVDRYLALLEDMNDALTEEEVEIALTDFIGYAIDIYGDWAKAKKGVKELAYLTEDDGETYKVKPGVYIGILEGKPYETLAEIVEAGATKAVAWLEARKQVLQNVVTEINNTIDNPGTWNHWREEAILKDPLETSLNEAQAVLDNTEATEEEIEDALEDLFIKAFRATHEKTGKILMVPLFAGAYGNENFENLTYAEQWIWAGEAPRFVNMEQLLLTTFEGEGDDREITEIDLNSLDDITEIIDRGIEFYLELLGKANTSETVEDVVNALEEFVDYTIEVYEDWEGATKGVEELPYFVEEDGETYKVIYEVAEFIFENKDYKNLQEMFDKLEAWVKNKALALFQLVTDINTIIDNSALWETRADFKADLEVSLNVAVAALSNPNPLIEKVMDDLMLKAFIAAKHKTGLAAVMDVYIDVYGNAKFEGLEDVQKELSEGIGFINMGKVKLTEFENDDPAGVPTGIFIPPDHSIDGVAELIDAAVDKYIEILDAMNGGESDIENYLIEFAEHAIEAYGDWTKAKKGVTELSLLFEDCENSEKGYKIVFGVIAGILEGKPDGGYETLAAVVEAGATKAGAQETIKLGALINLINKIEAIDEDLWVTAAGFKDDLDTSIADAKDVADKDNPTLVEIDEAIDDLIFKAFVAAKHKTGLMAVMPLYMDEYGNDEFASLTEAQQGKDEGIGFINMFKVKLTEFEEDNPSNPPTSIYIPPDDSINGVTDLIDMAIGNYKNILDAMNQDEGWITNFLNHFIEEAIGAYENNWEYAKKGVKELKYLADADPDDVSGYILKDEAIAGIFANQPYETLAEVVNAAASWKADRVEDLDDMVQIMDTALEENYWLEGPIMDDFNDELNNAKGIISNADGYSINDIEKAFEKLVTNAFKAVKNKEGLKDFLIPMFLGMRGNDRYENLTLAQKTRSEAVGFVYMEKRRRTKFDGDGNPYEVHALNSFDDITILFDQAVGHYLGFIESINNTENMHVGFIISKGFINDYVIEIYGSWQVAKEKMSELQYLAQDNPAYPDEDPGEFILIDGIVDNIIAARELTENGFETLAEIVQAAIGP